MAKSKIIKDLANGTVDTLTALKRAKVLLINLHDDKILSWVNNEIVGYSNDAPLPSYRQCSGTLIGSYIKGSITTHMKYNNVSLPLGNMPEDIKDHLIKIEFRDGIDSLKGLYESSKNQNGHLSKSIPADFFPFINKYNNDPYMIISTASVTCSAEAINNIFSVVENKLLDILILLEKEFGVLDELDIDTATLTKEQIKDIANEIRIIVYNNNSITIGDGNKIKDSTISVVNDSK